MIYLSDKYRDADFHRASVTIFEATGIRTRKLDLPPLATILERFRGFIP